MFSEIYKTAGDSPVFNIAAKEYTEEEYLSLSGIQHFEFCRRQWAENLRTVEGNIFHKRAHDGKLSEKRKDIITARGMRIFSKSLGISGVCDIVEFQRDDDNGVPIFGRDGRYAVYPVEYKKGETKVEDMDVLQLAAQAMCLEEMLCCEIKHGFIYYGKTRHRIEVKIKPDIRSRVIASFEEMHQYFSRRYTPKVKRTKSCNACSLKDICLPVLCKNTSVKKYITGKIKEDEWV